MSAYIWMILSVAQTKYVPDLKIGTLISNMIPMSIVLQIAWIIVVVIWMMIGLPFGPDVGVALPAGILLIQSIAAYKAYCVKYKGRMTRRFAAGRFCLKLTSMAS